ncbi:hypothetical protein MUP01_10955, partial [Candidatus Bathyarchaeota archaeon]|nr:hypothetical protein [Candidatus Bathyarchaeota archaeon]
MLGYQYPSDVFDYLKKNWKTKIYSEEKIPDLPNDDCLRNIIDAAYLASLQTEETRHAQVRIAYISPNAP